MLLCINLCSDVDTFYLVRVFSDLWSVLARADCSTLNSIDLGLTVWTI